VNCLQPTFDLDQWRVDAVNFGPPAAIPSAVPLRGPRPPLFTSKRWRSFKKNPFVSPHLRIKRLAYWGGLVNDWGVEVRAMPRGIGNKSPTGSKSGAQLRVWTGRTIKFILLKIRSMACYPFERLEFSFHCIIK